MQLLGGIWIAQIFPAVVLGAFTRFFHPWALFAGWLVGMISGTWMVASLGLKTSVYPVPHAGKMYAAVPALALNFLLAAALSVILPILKAPAAIDRTDPAAYLD